MRSRARRTPEFHTTKTPSRHELAVFARRDYGKVSFRLDVGLANDVAVIVALLADMGGEIVTADANRIEPQIEEFRLDVGGLHGGSEPDAELGGRLLRRLRRRVRPETDVHLVVLVAYY